MHSTQSSGSSFRLVKRDCSGERALHGPVSYAQECSRPNAAEWTTNRIWPGTLVLMDGQMHSGFCNTEIYRRCSTPCCLKHMPKAGLCTASLPLQGPTPGWPTRLAVGGHPDGAGILRCFRCFHVLCVYRILLLHAARCTLDTRQSTLLARSHTAREAAHCPDPNAGTCQCPASTSLGLVPLPPCSAPERGECEERARATTSVCHRRVCLCVGTFDTGIYHI